MPLRNARELKQIFHLTALDNMPSIIQNGLMPRQLIRSRGKEFCDIADQGIIEERNTIDLNAYIPFHFHPYSSFDIAVKASHPETQFVYIALKREFARYSGFKVISAHPLSDEKPELLDYDEGFAQIDWDAISQGNEDRRATKQARMAECLTDRIIPAALFQNVYVHDEQTKKHIECLFEQNGITDQPPYVNIMPQWV